MTPETDIPEVTLAIEEFMTNLIDQEGQNQEGEEVEPTDSDWIELDPPTG